MNNFPVIAECKEKLPDDVSIFLHDADVCQYLSGEWDSSLPRKRKKELSDEINKKCSNIYQRQERIRKK